MNQKTTYEHLITDKLNGIPLPDMSDAIWARIEKQLDSEMPTDDGGTDPGPESPSGSGWIGGAGLFIFVVALVSIFLISKNTKKKVQPIQPVNAIQKTNNIKTTNTLPGVPDSNKLYYSKPQVNLPAVLNNTAPATIDNTPNLDSLAVTPQLIPSVPPKIDTTQQLTTVAPPPVKQDTIKQKRSRGVKGITDNDYRIVPTAKDSS